jgi:hypothetical protein
MKKRELIELYSVLQEETNVGKEHFFRFIPGGQKAGEAR